MLQAGAKIESLSRHGQVSRANEKPRPGETGALRTEGGVSGCGEIPSILSRHVDGASPLAAPHSIAKDRSVRFS